MFINDLIPFKLSIFLSIPMISLMIKTLVFSIIFYKFKNIFLGILFISSFFYFGAFPVILLIIIFTASTLFGSKILKFNQLFISFFIGFLFFIQIYILISLITNLKIALTYLFLFSILLIFLYFLNKKMSFPFYIKEFTNYLNQFNIIDLWILTISFVIGTLPQTHWDAVHANLYNAKQYVLNNSFSILTESISSLFPQNAIGYYSFFYQIGKEKVLQLSYLLPLIILLIILKNISQKIHLKDIFWNLFLLTPIMIFQASNGYYDLLILVTIFTIFYISYFQSNKNLTINILVTCFLIGFIAAMKYFPLILIFIPLINYIFFTKNKIKNSFLVFFFGFFLCVFPLSIWLIRSYLYTGSPIFPFYQSFFPTPKFWSGEELTNNFMIKTTMNINQWVSGGFLLYPIISYFKTPSFLEANNGFTGIIYILILPIQIISLVKVVKNLIIKKFNKNDFFYLYSFIAYFIIGLITRYYRYLWPYQFLWASITLIYISDKIIKIKLHKFFIIDGVFIFILLININNIISYFRFFPIIPERFFKSNYYYISQNKNDPIVFLNQKIANNQKIRIIDASKYFLPRFHFNTRVYQCNWYWFTWINSFKNLNYFDYLITSNPTVSASNFCIDIIKKEKEKLIEIFQNKDYIIFKIKK